MNVLATNRGHSRSAHSHPTEQLTRFVVVCAARTGSTMLCHMLNSHPSILCHGEVLGGGRGQSADRLVDVDYDTASALADQLETLRNSDPVRFLEEAVYVPRTASIVGFKAKYEELLKEEFAAVLKWLMRERTVKIIHVIRRNRLKRLASQILAVEVYGTFQVTDDKARPKMARVPISPERCAADFERTAQREQMFRKRFETHAMFEIAYEDLVDPDGAVLRSVQGFLGVAPGTLRTPTRKVNPDRLDLLIENYRELQDIFGNSPYAEYFATPDAG